MVKKMCYLFVIYKERLISERMQSDSTRMHWADTNKINEQKNTFSKNYCFNQKLLKFVKKVKIYWTLNWI